MGHFTPPFNCLIAAGLAPPCKWKGRVLRQTLAPLLQISVRNVSLCVDGPEVLKQNFRVNKKDFCDCFFGS